MVGSLTMNEQNGSFTYDEQKNGSFTNDEQTKWLVYYR